MTKLEILYKSIQGQQDLGLPLDDETLKAADELEEYIAGTQCCFNIHRSNKRSRGNERA